MQRIPEEFTVVVGFVDDWDLIYVSVTHNLADVHEDQMGGYDLQTRHAFDYVTLEELDLPDFASHEIIGSIMDTLKATP